MSGAGEQQSGGSTIADWRFHDQHIQTNSLSTSSISAESTLVASGPPLLSQIRNPMADIAPFVPIQGANTPEQADGLINESITPISPPGGDFLFPIGLLESFALNQSKQIQRIFEIGSARSYFIPGRTIQGLTLGRVFFNGPNLLRSLYASYKASGEAPEYEGYTSAVSIEHTNWAEPGFGHFLINLQADLFNQPFGLAVFFRDQKGRFYGAFYCEMCYIQAHTMSVSSGSVLIVEGVTVQFDTVRPIDITGSVADAADKWKVSTPPKFVIGPVDGTSDPAPAPAP